MYRVTDSDTGAFRVVSDDMWHGFKYGVPGLYHAYDNDFFQYAAGDWTVTAVGAGTQALTDIIGGALLLTNAAADNDLISMQLGAESFIPTAGKKIFFETRFQCSEATQIDWLFGLVVTDTSPLTTTNGIVFRKPEDVTRIDCVSTVGSVESVEASVGTFAAATWTKVGFVVTGTAQIDYYLNDVLVATILDVPTTEMRVTMHVQNGDGNARNMTVDVLRCYQEI